MARKLLLETDEFPYHIMNRSNNRESFYISSMELWKIFIDCLIQINTQLNCQIHAFVLMSNHYHLLMSTPNRNLSIAMTYLHREVARKSNKVAERINHFFGARYKWCKIENEVYYWNAVKYIYQNPIKAGLCNLVEDYRFSSLNDSENSNLWQMTDFFFDRNQQISLDLDWLNSQFQSDEQSAIQHALRRRTFSLPKNKHRQIQTLQLGQYKKMNGH